MNPNGPQVLSEENEVTSKSVEEAQISLKELVQQVASQDKQIILTQAGKEMAAVVSIEAFNFLQRAVEILEDQTDVAQAENILAETKPEEYLLYEQIRQELELE